MKKFLIPSTIIYLFTNMLINQTYEEKKTDYKTLIFFEK